MKYIKSEKELVGGTFYIRACVNYVGDCWVETHRVDGMPFTAKSIYNKGPRKIHIGSNRYDGEYYLSDLGVGGGRTTKLFPFSNKLYNMLKPLTKDKRAFVSFLSGRTISDFEWLDMTLDWAFERSTDDLRYGG